MSSTCNSLKRAATEPIVIQKQVKKIKKTFSIPLSVQKTFLPFTPFNRSISWEKCKIDLEKHINQDFAFTQKIKLLADYFFKHSGTSDRIFLVEEGIPFYICIEARDFETTHFRKRDLPEDFCKKYFHIAVNEEMKALIHLVVGDTGKPAVLNWLGKGSFSGTKSLQIYLTLEKILGLKTIYLADCSTLYLNGTHVKTDLSLRIFKCLADKPYKGSFYEEKGGFTLYPCKDSSICESKQPLTQDPEEYRKAIDTLRNLPLKDFVSFTPLRYTVKNFQRIQQMYLKKENATLHDLIHSLSKRIKFLPDDGSLYDLQWLLNILNRNSFPEYITHSIEIIKNSNIFYKTN